MKKIKLTQGKYALVDAEDFDWLNQWKWHFDGNYAVRSVYLGKIDGKYRHKTIWMHRLINETLAEFETDHINKNKLDNQKNNLRIVTSQQNNFNRAIQKNNSSGHQGISWFKRDSKWRAHIKFNRIVKHLGYFSNIKDAISARKEAELLYFRF